MHGDAPVSELSAEAMSLRDNPAFQTALDRLKTGALEALAKINADDKNGILKLQATVHVVDEIRDNLDAFIRSGVAKPKAGIA
jgi:hypothetical protein